MADIKSNAVLREIPLDDLDIGLGQTRTSEIGKDLEDLAASISKVGLLEPIIVQPSMKAEGRFEILAGQRRFLACRMLNMKTITALVREKQLDTMEAKAVSATENILRVDPPLANLIDTCTEFYKHYGSIDAVVQHTGLPRSKVLEYVKYVRLRPELKKLFDDGGVALKTALKAQDAVMASGEYDAEEAVELAKQLNQMSNPNRDKAARAKQENPDLTVEQVVEIASKKEEEVALKIILGQSVGDALKLYASDDKSSLASAAVDLVHDGLVQRGFLSEEAD